MLELDRIALELQQEQSLGMRSAGERFEPLADVLLH